MYLVKYLIMQKKLLREIEKLESKKQRNESKIKNFELENKKIITELKKMYEIKDRFEKANDDVLNLLANEESLEHPV